MATESFSDQWQTLGTVPSSSLSDARLQLHWATQVVASFGNTVLKSQEDDSQSNLGWEDSLDSLCSRASSHGLSVGIRLADLTLLFLTSNNSIQTEYSLSGKTLPQAFDWLNTTYSQVSGCAPLTPFALRDYEMPSHPVGQSTPFSIHHVSAFEELQHWYRNAHAGIHDISSNWTQASPIRCWPHHFDLATLITLDRGKGSEEARSVGCGMSPGDGTYNEPYFYVTPWPYPKQEQLPDLPVGFWHTDGWIGAILTASDLIQEGSGDTQAERLLKFLQHGTEASFTALGITPS